MRALALSTLPFLFSCGGAASTPCPAAPVESATPAVSAPPSTSAPAASTPAPFTGSFDVTVMSDGKTSMTLADVIKKSGAVDGRMTWDIGKDSFAVGLWQVAAPQPSPENENDNLYSFCRAQGSVSAHWEGMTLVLASAITARGGSEAIRVNKKHEDGKTITLTIDKAAGCSASFKGLRITFEVLDKDGEGPTRLRATSDESSAELVRGTAQSAVTPKDIVKAL